MRDLDEGRERVSGELDVIQVQPGPSTQTLPLGQVVQGVELQWEDSIIARWDRKREIAIQDATDGVTLLSLRADVEDEFQELIDNRQPSTQLQRLLGRRGQAYPRNPGLAGTGHRHPGDHGDETHAQGVTLPDFPGCLSAADQWEDIPSKV